MKKHLSLQTEMVHWIWRQINEAYRLLNTPRWNFQTPMLKSNFRGSCIEEIWLLAKKRGTEEEHELFHLWYSKLEDNKVTSVVTWEKKKGQQLKNLTLLKYYPSIWAKESHFKQQKFWIYTIHASYLRTTFEELL